MTSLRGCRRILVIGGSGAGKSTLTRELGRAHSLPVVYLDQHYWQPGWIPMDDESWDVHLETLLRPPEWIMDGAYHRTLPRRLLVADAVVYLDLPGWLCELRVLKRIISGYGRTREDLAEDCPEKWDPEFLLWAWNWRRDIRPIVEAALAQAPPRVRVIRLQSARSVARWLKDEKRRSLR